MNSEHIDFILGKIKSGILQLITLGGLGIWSLIDLILISSQNFKDSNKHRITENNKKHLNIVIVICIILIIFNIINLINGAFQLKNLKIYSSKIAEFNNSIEIDNLGMQVFIYQEATSNEIKDIEKKLKNIKEIDQITYVSQEEAYNQMKEKLQDKPSLMEGLDSSIFSPSYIITLKDPKSNEKIEAQINTLDNVKKVTNGYNSTSLKLYESYYKTFVFTKIISITSIILRILNTSTLILINFIIFEKKKHI